MASKIWRERPTRAWWMSDAVTNVNRWLSEGKEDVY
jgi:hypothetical protein